MTGDIYQRKRSLAPVGQALCKYAMGEEFSKKHPARAQETVLRWLLFHFGVRLVLRDVTKIALNFATLAHL